MRDKDLVQSLYAAFARGDLDTIYAACDSRIEWYSNVDASVVPWGGERKGVDGVKRFFVDLLGSVDFESFEPRQFLEGEGFVVVLGRTVARARPTGVRIEDEWAHLLWVRNGKITRFREYADSHAIAHGFQDSKPARETGAGAPLHH